MQFKSLHVKEIATLIFTPVLFLNTFLVDFILQNIKEFSFVYLDRYTFILLGVLIVIYVMIINKVVTKAFSGLKTVFKNLIVFFLSFLSLYYMSTFIHPIGEGILFLNMFAISLGINIFLTLIISLIIKRVIFTRNRKLSSAVN